MDDTVDIQIIFDNGPVVPVEFSAPFTIKQTRGTDPWMFNLILSNTVTLPESANQGQGCKCAFKFSTPATNGGRTTVFWQNLYLVRSEPGHTDNGTFKCTFGDERWKAQYKRHTMSFNIQWPDGSYRAETTPQGDQRPWKSKEALVEAFKRMGYEIDVSALQTFTGEPPLPNNLGNSPAGGWVEATFAEIVKPILAALSADLILGADGKFRAVEMAGPNKGIEKLRGLTRIVDTVGKAQNGWERPRKLRVAFEVMCEAVLESQINTSRTVTDTATVSTFDLPDNVMPRYTLALEDENLWWLDVIGEVAKSDWESIGKQLVTLGYMAAGVANGGLGITADQATEIAADELLARNWYLPSIIPYKRNEPMGPIQETAEEILKKAWTDSAIRECWRSVYRVKFPTGAGASELNKDLRSLAGIRFGRLTPGGDSHSRSTVFCDWYEENAMAVRNKQATDPFDAEFSINHPFRADRPAPFSAKWIAQNGNELIFQMLPTESHRLGQAGIGPGLVSGALKAGTWALLSLGFSVEGTTLQTELQSGFDFRVFMSGRLIQADGRSGVPPEIESRVHVSEYDLFPEGSMERLDIKSEKVTANYGYSAAQQVISLGDLGSIFPSAHLNATEIKEFGQRIRDNVKKDFELGESGGFLVAGVEPVALEIYTGGSIHEMSIVVGDPDPWSITTQYFVSPGVRAWDIDPDDRDGKTPALITNE